MKKLKIYLDTSIISHLHADDVPEKMNDTIKLWKQIKQGEYDVIVSDVTLDEVNKCRQPKLALLVEHLAEIDYTLVVADEEVYSVAKMFVENNTLTEKSFDDCLHIASSMVYDCDIIVSWNFKHIVNYRTIKGVKFVSLSTGYDEVAIYTPTILVEGGEI